MSAPEQDYEQADSSATWTGGDHDAGAAPSATCDANPSAASIEPTAAAGGGGPQVAQQNMHYIEVTGRWTYTDAEGVSFEYDENLKAWFPMVSALPPLSKKITAWQM